jgi:hypothetical protein
MDDAFSEEGVTRGPAMVVEGGKACDVAGAEIEKS